MEVFIEYRCQREDLPKLPKNVLKAFYRKIEPLAQNSALGKPLVGELKRYRRLSLAGRYRILYTVDEKADKIWVVAVGIRKEGGREDLYERVRKMGLKNKG